MASKPPRTLRVFIGCPGDMAPERDALLTLKDKLARHGCPVEFLVWPDVPPSAGRPQQVIFAHFPVETWDIFIGILWMRFGTNAGEKDDLTGKPMTGTEEEFKAAHRAWRENGGRKPHVAIYRCERDGNTKGKGRQIAAVDEFFEQLSADAEYHGLAGTFQTTEEFKEKVERDLEAIIKKIHAAESAARVTGKKAVAPTKKAVDWAAAEARYRQHLIDSHRIVKFHTAEARAPVEVDLEKVFIKLMARSKPTALPDGLSSALVYGFPRFGRRDFTGNRRVDTSIDEVWPRELDADILARRVDTSLDDPWTSKLDAEISTASRQLSNWIWRNADVVADTSPITPFRHPPPPTPPRPLRLPRLRQDHPASIPRPNLREQPTAGAHATRRAAAAGPRAPAPVLSLDRAAAAREEVP